MITVTNNYFQDLNAAIAAGIIAKVGGKNPKKADLYDAIASHQESAAHNQATVEVEPVDMQASIQADDEELALQEQLLAMDAIEDAEKAIEAETKVKQPRTPKELHLSAVGNKAVKPGTKVEREVDLLRQGVTKEEMLEGLGWKNWSPNRSAALECGYGIRRDATGKYWLVEALRVLAA